jgi:hemerythrin superfamily protein
MLTTEEKKECIKEILEANGIHWEDVDDVIEYMRHIASHNTPENTRYLIKEHLLNKGVPSDELDLVLDDIAFIARDDIGLFDEILDELLYEDEEEL